jgi:hypothetical protein
MRRADRFENLFRAKGMHEQADWMRQLKDHVNAVGVEGALAGLGEERAARSGKEDIVYEGGWKDMGHFAESYLNRNGISVTGGGGTTVSSMSPSQKMGQPPPDPYIAGDFYPKDPKFKNKLVESQHLPGLEKSEDVDKIMGGRTTHLTPDVVKKFDERFGEGQWVAKPYGEIAFAGNGVFFPQRVKQVQQDAKDALWNAGSEVAKHGFELERDKSGTVTGLKHKDGKSYPFGSDEYNETISGDVRHWGDRAEDAADNEHGAAMPGPKQFRRAARRAIWDAERDIGKHGFSLDRDKAGKVVGIKHEDGKKYKFGSKKYEETIGGDVRKAADAASEAADNEHMKDQPLEFMAQPAFKAVGVSDADRAAGKTSANAKIGREARVHLITRNGKVEVVPNSTWMKLDSLPVVFEDDDTREIARVAQEALEKFPKSEKDGQIYAPDVMLTDKGWKVVEANPANNTGSSGYLGNNPFIIDAYVSHLTGREPAHVSFIRKLLEGKK